MFYIRKPDRINYEFDYVLGKTLKEKRIANGYSLQQVADKLKTTKQAIFRYEKADVSMKNSTFQKFCIKFFTISINFNNIVCTYCS